MLLAIALASGGRATTRGARPAPKALRSLSSERGTGSAPRAQDSASRGRIIRFAGHDWRVKASEGRVGPGPNYFSDSDRNVEVDARGRLHLRILPEDNRWTCAEVVSVERFGYGKYRFDLAELPEDMNPRVVLGMFTWSDGRDYHHREIDIEISRWGNRTDDNAQFVVQPYTIASNIVRFSIPRGVRASTHAFTWSPESVHCESAADAAGVETRRVFKRHTFSRDIPRAGDENARINLWLMSGRPPSDNKPVEVVFGGFVFSKR